ncbi:MAG: rRNA pseudouridine synthase [Eggerthellaceae bacterium]|nr:rRNA pseudouridine synthase [Eggerthellaceae bacterium]
MFKDEKIRIQKFLARAGVASRRHCEELIDEGRILVNGTTVKKQGTKIDPKYDEILLDGKPVRLSFEKYTIMLNKPAGYLSAMNDERGKRCVSELVPFDKYPNLFHVGRLDFDSTGLLIFTTDGELAQNILHPKAGISKTYLAATKEQPSNTRLQILRKGIKLKDGITSPAEIKVLKGKKRETAVSAFAFRRPGASGLAEGSSVDELESSCILEVKMHEGRNRQIRRMFSAIAYPVLALHRVTIGSLKLGELERGNFRKLAETEIKKLIGESWQK